MSVVLCLPAHLCVSTAASRGQAPHGNASVRFWILGTEICSMGKSLRSFKPIFIVFFEAYGALILEAM